MIEKQLHCSICRTRTDGAPLCDRCARHLRDECKLAHVAIAAGARVGSGTIDNLRRGKEKLKEYDEWRAQIVMTTRWHLHKECEEANNAQLG